MLSLNSGMERDSAFAHAARDELEQLRRPDPGHTLMRGSNSLLAQIYGDLNLNEAAQLTSVDTLSVLKALVLIDELYSDNGKLFESIDPQATAWHEKAQEISRVLQNGLQMAKVLNKLDGKLDLEHLRTASLKKIVAIMETYGESSWLSLRFKPKLCADYAESVRVLGMITNISEQCQDRLETARLLLKLQELMRQTESGAAVLRALFPKEDFKANLYKAPFWYKISQIAYALIEFNRLINDLPVQDTLMELLKGPQPVYDKNRELRVLSQNAESYLLFNSEHAAISAHDGLHSGALAPSRSDSP